MFLFSLVVLFKGGTKNDFCWEFVFYRLEFIFLVVYEFVPPEFVLRLS